MGSLFDRIKAAVQDEHYIVSWHADERCEERGVTDWQLVLGLTDAELLDERPHTRPNPSVVVRQMLPDGTAVEAVWSWLAQSRRAKLVTVFFRD
jgi:hypothetical protein